MNKLHGKIRLLWKMAFVGIVALLTMAWPTWQKLTVHKDEIARIQSELEGVSPAGREREHFSYTEYLFKVVGGHTGNTLLAFHASLPALLRLQ